MKTPLDAVLCSARSLTCLQPLSNLRRCQRHTAWQAWNALTQDDRGRLRAFFTEWLSRLPDHIGERKDKKRLEEFVAEYGILDRQPKQHVHIFLLTSHINHACPDCANCTIDIDSAAPHLLTVKLCKDVGAGEELFISYSKRVPYGCAGCKSTGLQTVSAFARYHADRLRRALFMRG
jgi:hypothetical protein